MKTLLSSLVVVSAVILAGCGSSSSNGDSTGAGGDAPANTSKLDCYDHHNDTCQSFSAVPNDELHAWCSADGLEAIDQCPGTSVKATCTFTDRLGTNIEYWYQGDDATPDFMQSFCTEYDGTLTIN